MEEIWKIREDFLDYSENWIKNVANSFVQRFNKAISNITKITPKEKLEIRTIRQIMYNLKSKAEELGVVVDELKTVDEIGVLPIEEIKRIGNIISKKSEEINNISDEEWNKYLELLPLIPKFNKALRELDDETALKNRTTIRQIKFKLKMIRRYAVGGPSPIYGGMKEEDVEPLFDKECKVIV